MGKYKKLIFSQSFVNGEWVNESETKIQIKNPADLAVIAEVYDEGRSMVKKAIDAAHDAFKSWKAKSAKERSAILLKWYDLILEHKEEIATIMTLECGKPYAESLGEIDYGASYIQWFAEEAKRNYGDVMIDACGALMLLGIVKLIQFMKALYRKKAKQL